MPTTEFTIRQDYDTALDRAVFFDLSSHGKIALTGRDAVKFLHNLCTNDIQNLPIGGGCEAFLCNPRARTIAHLFVIKRSATELLLDMVPGLAEKVLKHLDRFLISEQVELADRTPELAMVRLVGPNAKSALEKALTVTVPDVPPLTVFESDRFLIRRQNLLELPGFDLFCSVDDENQLLDMLLAGGVKPAMPDVHEILRIEAGLPEYGKDMDDERFVVEVGRASQAICYTKGCYQGQEPIVMARDRGQVNKMLLGLTVPTPQGEVLRTLGILAHGTRLFHGDAEAGQVTSSTFSPRLQKVIALAYIRRGHQQPGTELVIDPPTAGRKAIVADLPLIRGA